LKYKQPGSHAYKKATVERPDIPNVLDREFTVSALNEVWCGDTTGSGSLAHLVAVIDLFARRVVGRSPMPTW
jgi:putative transposase